MRHQTPSQTPEGDLEKTIERAAGELDERMRNLKTRYREERRKLETRSFDPKTEN